MPKALSTQTLSQTAEVKHPWADLVVALERAVRNSEDNFLELGMNLQKIQLASSHQQKKISATMGLFKGSEQSGILQKISAYVHGSQTRTSSAQLKAAELCQNLQKMIHLVDTFSRKCHSLERAGLLLHVIGTNTGIECARAAAMEATFKVVSQDTIALAEQIRTATDSLSDQTTRARNEQTATLQTANRNIEALRELSQSSNKTTDDAMVKVSELVDYSINMVNHANQLAGEITLGINRVVMGIQFHDNLRQRVEHINHALLELPEDLAALTSEEHCQNYLNVELQKAQLDQLVEELESLYHTQNQALAHIVEEIYRLQGRLGGMASEKHQNINENPVAELLSGIASLEQLNTDSQTLGQGIAASAARANEVAREMQQAIQSTFSIATQVKINALNAIIKAAKFGPMGESLQVLAQGMVGVSRDVRQLVNLFNDLLQQLAELTRNDLGEKNATQNADSLETLDVQQVFDQFAAELQQARSSCDELAQNLERETRGLVFIGELKETLAVQAAQLGVQLAELEPPDQDQLTSQRNQFGSQLYQRYTMDEERAVHRRILSAIPAAAITSAAPAVDDCLFFDDNEPAAATADPSLDFGEIELFDAPPQSNEPELWGAAPAPGTEAGIELFDTPAPSNQRQGGEIELFDSLETPAEGVSSENSAALAGDEKAGSIELFDPPAPVEAQPKIEHWDDFTSPADSAAQTSDAEAQDPPGQSLSPGAEDEPKKATEKEDFGDNIELF